MKRILLLLLKSIGIDPTQPYVPGDYVFDEHCPFVDGSHCEMVWRRRKWTRRYESDQPERLIDVPHYYLVEFQAKMSAVGSSLDLSPIIAAMKVREQQKHLTAGLQLVSGPQPLLLT